MPESEPVPQQKSKSKLEDILIVCIGIPLGFLMMYVVIYWGIYRGGGFLLAKLTAAAQPIVQDPALRKDAIGTAGKLLLSTLGASVGAVLATFVRRWFILKDLREKIELLTALKSEMLQTITSSRGIQALALDGDAVKSILTEKNYAHLAKYLKPTQVFQVLRMISAVQHVSKTVQASLSTDASLHDASFAIEYLKEFDSKAILARLNFVAEEPDTAVEEAIEKSVAEH